MGNNIFPNIPMGSTGNNMGVNSNYMMANNMFLNNNIPAQNLSNLYPSIYRIINPVVSRVISNNNQVITEELLNNMTDTVFNIVEGQIDLGDDVVQRNTQNEVQSSSNTSSNVSNNTSSTRATENSRQTTQQTSFRNNRNDHLLRDLIKILIIKELLSRNQMQRQFSQNQFYYSQPLYGNM
ncbi:MAG: hypothetical protein IKL55_06190 [Clostridia bacterium]|nr:hypothetical protein [Clostridia bacterium]